MSGGTYMDSGRVEAAKKAVRENTVPAGHPAVNMCLYVREKTTAAIIEQILWTTATTENIAPENILLLEEQNDMHHSILKHCSDMIHKALY